jgi:hypothetical protein
MKKLFPIFLAIIIFFGSSFMQVKKVEAVGPLVGAVGVAAGAAAGPYIIAGLLVVSGAAILVGANDTQIMNKAKELYNNSSQTFKQELTAAATIATIKGTMATVNLSDSMINELDGMKADISTWLTDWIRLKEFTPTATTHVTNFRTASFYNDPYNNYVDNSITRKDYTPSYMYMAGMAIKQLHIKVSKTNEFIDLSFINIQDEFNSVRLTPAGDAIKYWLNNGLQSMPSADKLVDFVRIYTGIGLTFGATSSTVTKTRVNEYVDTAFNSLGGIKEVNIPLDQWLTGATTTTGAKVNVNTTTGVATLEDGSVYDGAITFPTTIPGSTAYPNTTVDSPAVPFDDVFPSAPTVTDPPKNPPKGRIDWSKLKMTAATLTTVFPFSIPWDVYRLFDVLNVPPTTPVFVIDINRTVSIFGKNIPIKYHFDINFGVFDPIAAIGRWGLILVFDIAIIMALRRLTPD